MPSARHPSVRLEHILEQIDGISLATQGLTFAEVRESYILRRAIERAVQIISEATKELPQTLRDDYPDVHWPPIIKIGNLLRHEYYRIDSRDMWEIASVHLPRLRPVILRMRADLSDAPDTNC